MASTSIDPIVYVWELLSCVQNSGSLLETHGLFHLHFDVTFNFSVIKIICFCTFHNTAQLSCHVQISNNIDNNGIPKQGIFNQILIMGKISLVKRLPVFTDIFSYTAEEITGKIICKGWNK